MSARWIRSPIAVLGGLVALLAATATGCGGRAAHPGTDVVLILIDTLRPDHLGFYGYDHETAPYLASLARDGTVFERANSTSSWTAPATASVFTGLYPTHHGIIEGFHAHRGRMREVEARGESILPLNRLPDDVTLVSETFHRAGYRTFGAASNINIGPAIGFDRGFDRFLYAHDEPADDLRRDILDWRDEMLSSSQPTFLYLHWNDVHTPYERHEPWYHHQDDERADQIAAYDSQIAYVDQQIEKLSRKLLWGPDTLVVVVSDHGEEFGEHGGVHHDGGLHQELTRVLMLFRGPGIPAGARVTEEVSLADLLPTLAALAGVPVEGQRDGRSLAPYFQAPSPERDARVAALADRTLFAHRAMKKEHYGQHWWAAIHRGWKLIEDLNGRTLYDHGRDFYEQQDRTAEAPEQAARLGAALDGFEAQGFRRNNPKADVRVDRDMLRELEKLGYVDTGEAPPAEDAPQH